MFSFLKTLLFPISCLACRSDTGTWLCENCQKKIMYEPKKEKYEEIDFPIYTLFQPNSVIRTTIHSLKYKWYEEASSLFHPLIHDFLSRVDRDPKNIICIPVPLHRKKLHERGFNQSEKLIPPGFKKLFIQKIHNTASQMGLPRSKRLTNLNNTFQCTTQLSEENIYIIIDDIVTTGSTIKELAKTLKIAGAKKIIGMALSRGT